MHELGGAHGVSEGVCIPMRTGSGISWDNGYTKSLICWMKRAMALHC